MTFLGLTLEQSAWELTVALALVLIAVLRWAIVVKLGNSERRQPNAPIEPSARTDDGAK